MNTQELINKIEQLPSNLLDKKVVIAKDSLEELVKQLDERTKVEIPQLVADWLEIARRQHLSLGQAMDHWEMSEKIEKWFQYANNQEMFARAWLDGYEVEQEKRYRVKFKTLAERQCYLNHDEEYDEWIFASMVETDTFFTTHTKSELEQAGFGDVFDNPMFEVEEVE